MKAASGCTVWAAGGQRHEGERREHCEGKKIGAKMPRIWCNHCVELSFVREDGFDLEFVLTEDIQ